MKTLTATIVLFASLTAAAQSQSLREKGQMDPLDCALYLNSICELNSNDISLVMSLYRLGRYDDIITSASKSIGFREFAHFGLERVKAGDKASAEKFAAAAKRNSEKDGNWWSTSDFAGYIELLIALDRIDESYKIAEKQDDPEDRSTLFLQIAESAVKFNKTGVAKIAVQRIPPDFFFSDVRDLIRQSDLYASLGNRDSQLRLLNRLELDISSKNNGDPPDRLRIELIRRYLSVGDESHSKSLWESVSDKEGFNKLLFIQALLKYGRASQAIKMLDAADPKRFLNASEVVRIYLDQKLADKALTYALATTDKDDDFDQQSAFMGLVDHFLASKDFKSAQKLLELADRKVSRIVYEHPPEASIGASPGSRKAIYLDHISKRYATLGKFDQALKSLNGLNVADDRAQEAFATAIAKFAAENAKNLRSTQVEDLVKTALQIAKEQDSDYANVDVAINGADAFAQLGQNEKAVEIIADLLEKYSGDYEEPEVLVRSGEVFERNKLVCNARLRTILSSIIADHEN